MERIPHRPCREPMRKDLSVVDCGVSVSWLVSWASSVKERLGPGATTAQVCAEIVIPETKAHKCRYVDLLDQSVVGAPEYFLSHTWSWRFQDLVNIVWRKLQSTPHARVWLDICAINQNKYACMEELQTDDIANLANVISKVDTTLSCLDGEGKALTRVWCVFEIWHTVKAKSAAGLLMLTYNYTYLQRLFQQLDVRKSQASLESDRQRILSEIEADIGQAQLTRCIKDSLVRSVDIEAQEAVNAYAECCKASGPDGGGDSPKAAAVSAADVSEKAGFVAHAAGNHEKARAHRVSCFELRDHVLGHKGLKGLSTLCAMGNLAHTLLMQGHLEEAEALQREAVEQFSRALGPGHLDTLTVRNSLAATLCKEGRGLDEAEGLLRYVLVRRQVILGSKYPATLHTITALAAVLWHQGKRGEAKGLLRQLTERYSSLGGTDCPSVLASLNDSARAVADQEGGHEAERQQRQAVEQNSRVLGAEHPSTLSAISELIITLSSMAGKQGETGTLLHELVERQGRVDGAEHPQMFSSASLKLQARKPADQQDEDEDEEDKEDEEEEVDDDVEEDEEDEEEEGNRNEKGKEEDRQRRAVEQKSRELGADHSETLYYSLTLSVTLYSKGKLGDAEVLLRQLCEQQSRVLGAEHPQRLTAMGNLASTLMAQGGAKEDEAETIDRHVLAVQRRVLGSAHFDTLTTVNNLGCTLRDRGKLAEAEGLLREAAQQRSKFLGAKHPLTLRSMSHWATTLRKQGRDKAGEAEDLEQLVQERGGQ